MWNQSEDQMTLVMIRHGATLSNREHRYLGKTDERLSEEGKRELKESVNRGRYPQVEDLFSSPMKRCVETAKLLYPDASCIQIPEWEEIDFGAFEGKNYMELQQDSRYQEWIDSNGTLPFPEGESRVSFSERAAVGFYRMWEQLLRLKARERIGSVGMIVHGGTIMALLSRFYGGDYYDYQVPNGGGYVCTLKSVSGEPHIIDIQKL